MLWSRNEGRSMSAIPVHMLFYIKKLETTALLFGFHIELMYCETPFVSQYDALL
jgi:hypothetical protein